MTTQYAIRLDKLDLPADQLAAEALEQARIINYHNVQQEDVIVVMNNEQFCELRNLQIEPPLFKFEPYTFLGFKFSVILKY